MFTDRKFRLARHWSNRELAKLAPLFTGDVVNVSAWEDRDKEGRCYKDYFVNAANYCCTNHEGYRGFQGMAHEYSLDLTADVPEELKQRFDVVFNHTTLEHIFDVREAFAGLCRLSRDVVILVVPFAQAQHDSGDWKDYWRFTPSCLWRLYAENGLTVVYEAESPYRHSAVYLLAIGSRRPEYWTDRLPRHVRNSRAGAWIGATLLGRARETVRSCVRTVRDLTNGKK
jgi:hypothetical protein